MTSTVIHHHQFSPSRDINQPDSLFSFRYSLAQRAGIVGEQRRRFCNKN